MTVVPSAIGAGTENRPGYTLEDGSGCLTIGVHLTRCGIRAGDFERDKQLMVSKYAQQSYSTFDLDLVTLRRIRSNVN
jgi:hypothetical protein